MLVPTGWLVLGLPWPTRERTRDAYAECAAALVPQMVPSHLVSQSAGDVVGLAAALAADPHEGPGKTVFLSDITRWLDGQGKNWPDLGVDHEAVIEELLGAPVPILFLSLSALAHLVVCDASRQGVQILYTDGRREHVTPQMRRDVHDGLTATLERDWAPYIQQLLASGPTQTQ